MSSRVYLIHQDGQPIALVRASSQAAAIRHIVKDKFEAVPADQDMLIRHLPKMGVMVTGEVTAEKAEQAHGAETRG